MKPIRTISLAISLAIFYAAAFAGLAPGANGMVEDLESRTIAQESQQSEDERLEDIAQMERMIRQWSYRPSSLSLTWTDGFAEMRDPMLATDASSALPALRLTEFMSRIGSDMSMPTGHSVAQDCQDPAADHPYRPYDWPEASATLDLEQAGSQTRIVVRLTKVRPHTYYTMWLSLGGVDPSGLQFGGSPLTGAPSTALVPTHELGDAIAATGPGNGSTGLSNGFWSDANGNATWTSTLDFAIIGGAYPFDRFVDFDPSDERLPLESPRAFAVAIANSGVPFTVRVASHCTDGTGHGLVPGAHEGWFDWLPSGS